MTLTALCDCNGEPTPIFRLSAVILDGRHGARLPEVRGEVQGPHRVSVLASIRPGGNPAEHVEGGLVAP